MEPLHFRSDAAWATTCPYNRTKVWNQCISAQTLLGLQTCLNCPIYFPMHSRSNATRAPDMSLLSHLFSIAFPLKRRSGSRHSIIFSIAFPISHWGMLPRFVRSLGVLLASLHCWGCSLASLGRSIYRGPIIGVQLNISIRS